MLKAMIQTHESKAIISTDYSTNIHKEYWKQSIK